MTELYKSLVKFVRELYHTDGFIPLHVPTFDGNEAQYVRKTIDSTFVSSVGEYVDHFERLIAEYTGAAGAVATVNGTAALHAALHLAGVVRDELVITQPLTFVATANAVRYCGADPVFLDVDEDTMGLSPTAVEAFFKSQCRSEPDGTVRHLATGRRVAACVPMHTYGFPMRVQELIALCSSWGIPVVEDAAESLGSYLNDTHSGRFGIAGILSFNGNKTITTGGGGMIITDDEKLAGHAKHLTTTAKVSHRWEHVHDELGFNYRLPNLNAALGCAQMEQLSGKLAGKRSVAEAYIEFFGRAAWRAAGYRIITERPGTQANYWLNALVCPDRQSRDAVLAYTNDAGVMTRPAWQLMYRLPPYESCLNADCPAAEDLAERLVNLPSSPTAVVN